MTKKIEGQEEFLLLKKKNEEFIATLLHDIKSPMMSINIALSNNLKNELLRDIYKINLANINFIENLLYSYSFESGETSLNYREVDLTHILHEQISIFKHLLIEKRLNIKVAGFQSLPPVNSCPVSIGRVFANLLSNAHKYALHGSEVSIEARASSDSVVIEFSNAIRHKDQGFCDNIFDKFYTQKRYFSQGLGLHICKKIIKGLGGKIWVKSADKKITFYVELKIINR